MIRTGLPTNRLALAQRWANDSTIRPRPTPTSANSHARTTSDWRGACSFMNTPSTVTAIAPIEIALITGTTPSSTSERKRVRYSPRR